jgi:hypothetical protein
MLFLLLYSCSACAGKYHHGVLLNRPAGSFRGQVASNDIFIGILNCSPRTATLREYIRNVVIGGFDPEEL